MALTAVLARCLLKQYCLNDDAFSDLSSSTPKLPEGQVIQLTSDLQPTQRYLANPRLTSTHSNNHFFLFFFSLVALNIGSINVWMLSLSRPDIVFPLRHRVFVCREEKLLKVAFDRQERVLKQSG